jgi:hypothetical protein
VDAYVNVLFEKRFTNVDADASTGAQVIGSENS